RGCRELREILHTHKRCSLASSNTNGHARTRSDVHDEHQVPDADRGRRLGTFTLGFRNGLEQELHRFPKWCSREPLSRVLTQSNDDQAMRGDDGRGLAPSSAECIGGLGYRQSAIRVDPYVGSPVPRPSVRNPGGCRLHGVRYESLREDPLSVPNPVLKDEIPKACPLPSRRVCVPLPQEVAVGICLDIGVADADPVEEISPGERVILLTPPFDA